MDFPDKPLSNYDLEELAHKYKLPLIGVFSKDELPDKLQVGSYYINMQNSTDGQGTHWILVKIFDAKHAFYFDSFGERIPIEVMEFLKNYKPIPYSHRQIQDVRSSRCGLYVVACDLYMSQIKRRKMLEQFDDFLNMFKGDTKQNDSILVEFLEGS